MGSKRVLFGTDGIRGKANIYPMTCEVAMSLGRAVANYFQKRKRNHTPLIIVGKDTRVSCYMLELAFCSGICSQGGKAIMTGPLPTPGIAHVTRSMRADAGVMISASHNPYYDNGIKIFDGLGHKLHDEVEEELERMVLADLDVSNRSEEKFGGDLGRAMRLDEVHGRYIEHVKMAFDRTYSLENIRLVVDAANGAAYKVAPLIFSELGADVICIGNTPNGKNINERVGAVYPEKCAENVLRYRADLGICLDGDGDRVIFVDHTGTVVDGDRVIALGARFLKDKGVLGVESEVVGTVMTNYGVEKYLEGIDLKLVRTAVGDRYIMDYMKKSQAIFGGEPSGHIIFRQFSTTGDGILSALKIIESLMFYNQSIRDLTQNIPMLPQQIKNISVSRRIPLNSIPAIEEARIEVEQFLYGRGRLVLRYSGTEPLIRIMVEAEAEKDVAYAVERMEKILLEHLT